MGKSRAEQRAETRRFWERHLRAWRESGIAQSQYCRENDLRVHQFIYWKKRIPADSPGVSLVELPAELVSMRSNDSGGRETVSPTPTGAPLRLFIDGRYCVEIERGYDPAALEHLVRILTRS